MVRVWIEIVLGRASGAAAIQAERPVITAVRAHLQHRLVLEETIVAAERNPAAEFAGAGLVGDEFISRDRHRHFGLGDLDRLRRHVRHHVRIAVEAVGPRASAPRTAGEVHIDERLARLVVAADRDAGVAAVAGRRHLVGQHHGERAEHAVHHAEPGQSARRAGGRQHAVADRARRTDHIDRAEHAFVARNDLRQHRAHRAVGRRLGERQRVVDCAFHLRAGAGPVDHHAAAGLADGDEQADRLAVVDAVVVDPVLEAPFAVGKLGEFRAREALRVVEHVGHQVLGTHRSILGEEFGELPLGDMAGGELRAQIARHLDRQPDVPLDERHDGLVELAGLVEFQRRDAQALGVDLGRVRRVRAGNAPADIGVMAAGAGEREPLALVIKRLEDEDVRQVHAAVERIVHDEDIARRHVVAVVAHDRRHRGRDRAKVPRKGQALRDKLAVGIREAGGVIHVVLEHARIRRAENGQRHFVRDREQCVLEQLKQDRIVGLGHQSHPLKRCAFRPRVHVLAPRALTGQSTSTRPLRTPTYQSCRLTVGSQ